MSTNHTSADELRKAWGEAPAATTPVPTGDYQVKLLSARWARSRNGTLTILLKFQTCAGEFSGRVLWDNCYMTRDAVAYSRRRLRTLGFPDDLDRLGFIDDSRQDQARLDNVTPAVQCIASVVLKSSGKSEFNEITVIREVKPLVDTKPEAVQPGNSVAPGCPTAPAGSAGFDFSAFNPDAQKGAESHD